MIGTSIAASARKPDKASIACSRFGRVADGGQGRKHGTVNATHTRTLCGIADGKRIMTTQHYRGYDIDILCASEQGRYGCSVRIVDADTREASHAWTSDAQAFSRATEAQDKGFQYARAWIEQHSLRWPFTPRR